MKVHYLQHVSFEGPGAIAAWARTRGHMLAGTSLFRDEPLPATDAFDLLVVMGGPMSVNDEREYPWLVREKALVREAIEAGKSVLGICLGAQILANALGARVYRAREKEIGWFPVRLGPEGQRLLGPAGWSDPFTPFHWHGETFDLPPGVVHLAETGICPNQAFAHAGGRAVGLQFHLEVTAESVRDLISSCRTDLDDGPFVQSEEEVQGTAARFAALEPLLFGLLDQM